MNPWRRFRNLALWKQVIAWVVAGIVVLGGISAAIGEDTSSTNVATVTATTTTAAPTTTTLPTTAAPTTTLPLTTTPSTTSPPTTAVPSSTTAASPPTASPSVAPTTPATAPSAGPGGCYPLSSSGNCYRAGQFCSASDNGKSGIAANGQKITCRPSGNRYRWEAS
jgi:hypothetical protein